MADELTERIARRVRERRHACGWTLDDLAERSGVSRSNISLIERGESNATAVVLDRLATALDVTLGDLLGDDADRAAAPVLRRAEQPVWVDPASGYRRRSLTPPAAHGDVQVAEITFPAGAAVSFDHVGRPSVLHQQVWVLSGAMVITVGDAVTTLGRGDSVAFDVDRPTVFRNTGPTPARYVLVQHVGRPTRPRDREDR